MSEQTDVVALTDEKWLGFVVEQVLSNAVKYTSAGSISIKCDEDRLVISDTGIGIAAEDLPRIFDKGQGTPQEYSVESLKIYPKGRTTHRNFLLKVTDPALINQTGGIVQGMSGSPILQDGKLIGAVTHVLVNDPTCGYGIFIEHMLQAAG